MLYSFHLPLEVTLWRLLKQINILIIEVETLSLLYDLIYK